MALKIAIALILIAIVIAAAIIALHIMDKKDEETKENEPIPTFDFKFDKQCKCEHCEHHKEEEKE